MGWKMTEQQGWHLQDLTATTVWIAEMEISGFRINRNMSGSLNSGYM